VRAEIKCWRGEMKLVTGSSLSLFSCKSKTSVWKDDENNDSAGEKRLHVVLAGSANRALRGGAKILSSWRSTWTFSRVWTLSPICGNSAPAALPAAARQGDRHFRSVYFYFTTSGIVFTFSHQNSSSQQI